LAVAQGVALLQAGRVDRIVLSRPAVEAGEKLGYLPGDLKEKVDPYLRPLYDALHDMMPAEQVARRMAAGEIEVAPLAFMRGRTLAHCYAILDEAQNTTPAQMKMFLTRMGEGSRMVVTGDPTQVDLPPGQGSGLAEALSILDGVDGIAVARFSERDVVRHPLVAVSSRHMAAPMRTRPMDAPTPRSRPGRRPRARRSERGWNREVVVPARGPHGAPRPGQDGGGRITVLLATPGWRARRAAARGARAPRRRAALRGRGARRGHRAAGGRRAVKRLNGRHRAKAKPDQRAVLSRPAPRATWGDVALALGVVRREARQAGRRAATTWRISSRMARCTWRATTTCRRRGAADGARGGRG
jgi:hypothetical protein